MLPRPSLAAPALSALLLVAACGSSAPEPLPPPLPSAPTAVAVDAGGPTAAEPVLVAEAEPAKHGEHHAGTKPVDDDKPAASGEKHTASADKDRGLSLYELAKRGEAQLPASAKPAAPKPSPAPTKVEPTPAPAPAKPPTPAPAKPRTSVAVPSTERVHIDVTAALQANLDKDPRMQPWLNKVVGVIDGCFVKQQASNPGVRGTIEVSVTLHENERPDADVRSLPPALSGMVACATGALMRTKMPLFTGPEGQRSTVKLRFGE